MEIFIFRHETSVLPKSHCGDYDGNRSKVVRAAVFVAR